MSRHFHTTRADRIAADIARQKNAEFLAAKAADARPECTAGGMIQPGAMCGSVIVGGKFCGFAGDCAHKRAATPGATHGN